MRIEFNPRGMHFDVYTDTDSEYASLKALSDIPNISTKQLMKLQLNSVYGKAVTDMIKNYIVVHPTGSCKVAIIFKDKITGIFKHDDGTADVLLESGSMFALLDKYEDIIKYVI